MRKSYATFELEVLSIESEDVLTTSADFTDTETGDNGVWFPGQNPNGQEDTWQ